MSATHSRSGAGAVNRRATRSGCGATPSRRRVRPRRLRRAGMPWRPAAPLAPYVNDRPYVASSFMSVAIAKVFGTAMSGRSPDRQGLADTAIPLEVTVPVLPSRGGEEIPERLSGPLGYEVSARSIPLDERFPDWGPSPYVHATLRATARVAEVLRHLYVLLPVLDDAKHYWVSTDEIDKLLRRGEGWLGSHPERELIAQ